MPVTALSLLRRDSLMQLLQIEEARPLHIPRMLPLFVRQRPLRNTARRIRLLVVPDRVGEDLAVVAGRHWCQRGDLQTLDLDCLVDARGVEDVDVPCDAVDWGHGDIGIERHVNAQTRVLGADAGVYCDSLDTGWDEDGPEAAVSGCAHSSYNKLAGKYLDLTYRCLTEYTLEGNVESRWVECQGGGVVWGQLSVDNALCSIGCALQ